jgi:transmembrane sensor
MRDIIDFKLVSRYLSCECSSEERKKVEEWIAAAPNHGQMMKLFNATWGAQDVKPSPSDVGQMWNAVAAETSISVLSENLDDKHEQKRISKIYTWPVKTFPAARVFRYAAIVIFASGISYFGLRRAGLIPGMNSQKLVTHIVENCKRLKVTLSDGTRVTLDAGSRFEYPKKFSEDSREVYLNGEGFFEVAPDARKAFVVHAQEAVVRVLGTKFNVRAWNRTEKVVVAVKEGKVAFGLDIVDSVENVILNRDQMSQIEKGASPTEPEIVDVDKYLGWMKNEIVFEDTELKEVLSQLERWYDLRFVISDSMVMNERLTIHIKGKSVDDILKLLSVLTDLSYEREDQKVRLYEDD